MMTSDMLFQYLSGFPMQLAVALCFFVIPLKKRDRWFLRFPLVPLAIAAEIGIWMLVFPKQPAHPFLPVFFFALHYLLIFIIYPVFKMLANTGHTMVITWIYVFTVILVLAFAIEIGQWYTGTGVMDSQDLAYGITGFLVMFLIFAIVRGTYLGIKQLVRRDDRDAGRYADGR